MQLAGPTPCSSLSEAHTDGTDWLETLLPVTGSVTQHESLLKAFAVCCAFATRGQRGKRKTAPFPFVSPLMLKLCVSPFLEHTPLELAGQQLQGG